MIQEMHRKIDAVQTHLEVVENTTKIYGEKLNSLTISPAQTVIASKGVQLRPSQPLLGRVESNMIHVKNLGRNQNSMLLILSIKKEILFP